MGTWQPDFDTYLNGFVALPMDLLCVHVYPVNDRTINGQNVDFLGRILQMADAAHAAGMKIGMGECWLYKETDSELSASTTDISVQERCVYSFWAPLDTMFLEAMAKTAYWKDFEFLNPFWSLYYFAYLDYDTEQPLIAGMSSAEASSFPPDAGEPGRLLCGSPGRGDNDHRRILLADRGGNGASAFFQWRGGVGGQRLLSPVSFG